MAYAAANRLCGDIVKVTPSSKVVGDLAQFMVSNKLDEKAVIEQAGTLSFPQSVIEYFQGQLGQPSFGFLEPFTTQVLEGRRLTRITGRPGASMKPLDLISLKQSLDEKFGKGTGASKKIKDWDVLSYALYPKVFEEFMSNYNKFGSKWKHEKEVGYVKGKKLKQPVFSF